jgi:hypothetical protein
MKQAEVDFPRSRFTPAPADKEGVGIGSWGSLSPEILLLTPTFDSLRNTWSPLTCGGNVQRLPTDV